MYSQPSTARKINNKEDICIYSLFTEHVIRNQSYSLERENCIEPPDSDAAFILLVEQKLLLLP